MGYNSNVIYACLNSGRLIEIDIFTKEIRKIFLNKNNPILRNFCISPCEKYIIYSSEDSISLTYSSLRTFKKIHKLEGHGENTQKFALSFDGKLGASFEGNSIIAWDLQHGKIIRQINNIDIIDLSVSNDGKKIFYTDQEYLYTYFVDANKIIKKNKLNPKSKYPDFYYITNSEKMISCDWDSNIRICDFDSPEKSYFIPTDSIDCVRVLATSNLDKFIFLCSKNEGIYDVYIHDTNYFKKNDEFQGSLDKFGSKKIHLPGLENAWIDSLSNKNVNIESIDYRIKYVIDILFSYKIYFDHEKLSNFLWAEFVKKHIVYSRPEKCEFYGNTNTLLIYFESSKNNYKIKYYNVICINIKSLKISVLFNVRLNAPYYFKAQLSSDGKLLLLGDQFGECQLWDTGNTKLIHIFRDHESDISNLTFSPDSKFFISSDASGKILIYDIKKLDCIGMVIEKRTNDFVVDWKLNKLSISLDYSKEERYVSFSFSKLPLGSFITTAQREIISEDLSSGPVTARPPCCGQVISIPSAIANCIEHWTQKGGEGGYTATDLLLDCPNCSTPLRMNPFFVDIRTKN